MRSTSDTPTDTSKRDTEPAADLSEILSEKNLNIDLREYIGNAKFMRKVTDALVYRLNEYLRSCSYPNDTEYLLVGLEPMGRSLAELMAVQMSNRLPIDYVWCTHKEGSPWIWGDEFSCFSGRAKGKHCFIIDGKVAASVDTQHKIEHITEELTDEGGIVDGAMFIVSYDSITNPIINAAYFDLPWFCALTTNRPLYMRES